MIKVITYGTFDLLHEGHINILRRAKALGDYLCVGVTTENFDVTRGKINVVQSLTERMEAVKATGYADEVFPEEYEGQKIDDIRRHGIDIFVVGSDWIGKFDYLREYCQVVYLPRTEGISSTQLRGKNGLLVGVVGEDPTLLKLKAQAQSVNGLNFVGVCTKDAKIKKQFDTVFDDYEAMLEKVDVVYVACRPQDRYSHIKRALLAGKHVLAESPIALRGDQACELLDSARVKGLVLFDCIKTAYSLPFSRMILLLKSGVIGEVKNIDVTCTSLENFEWLNKTNYYSSFTGWGAIGILPVLQILGLEYKSADFSSLSRDKIKDAFTKASFVYDNALATVNVGVGVKTEGDMRISGTDGYIYVPSPWWMSSRFEVKYEDAQNNKQYFFNNDGGGIQAELVHFVQCVNGKRPNFYVPEQLTCTISEITRRYCEYIDKI